MISGNDKITDYLCLTQGMVCPAQGIHTFYTTVIFLPVLIAWPNKAISHVQLPWRGDTSLYEISKSHDQNGLLQLKSFKESSFPEP